MDRCGGCSVGFYPALEPKPPAHSWRCGGTMRSPAEAYHKLSAWLRRRLLTMPNCAPAERKVQLCLARLCMCLEAFPSFAALAPLRVIGNACPARCAYGGMPSRSLSIFATMPLALACAHLQHSCAPGCSAAHAKACAFRRDRDAAGSRGSCRFVICCLYDI